MAKAAKKNMATAVLDPSTRYDELKTMLDERCRVILQEVQGRIRGVRAEGADRPHESADPGETAEVDIQEDIEFALIQMKAETLNKINEALARLDEGRYGHCYECGDEIAEARLRALPFAVRCKDCEEERETAILRERTMSRRGSSSFFDMQR
jgi:DnaK suppressor protein